MFKIEGRGTDEVLKRVVLCDEIYYQWTLFALLQPLFPRAFITGGRGNDCSSIP